MAVQYKSAGGATVNVFFDDFSKQSYVKCGGCGTVPEGRKTDQGESMKVAQGHAAACLALPQR